MRNDPAGKTLSVVFWEPGHVEKIRNFAKNNRRFGRFGAIPRHGKSGNGRPGPQGPKGARRPLRHGPDPRLRRRIPPTVIPVAASSAGILMYRGNAQSLEVLLVHPGGPFWRSKDNGAWSIPKGEIGAGEDPEEVAQREFMEELGSAPAGTLRPLGEIRQRGGKRVHAFAINSDLDVSTVASNTFEMEWPPKSGRTRTFPEIDRAEWFTLPVARAKILEGQRPLLDRLEEMASR
jgi:predicted NUDIX family NTP pyrophosphohydrolase